MGSWAVQFAEEGAEKFVVLIDERYRTSALREGRNTRISVRFIGSAMLKSAADRADFEKQLLGFLRSVNGVFVLTVAQRDAYSFHAYTNTAVDPQAVPIPAGFRECSTVNVYDEPDWNEYESWLPSQPSLIAALLGRVANMFTRFR